MAYKGGIGCCRTSIGPLIASRVSSLYHRAKYSIAQFSTAVENVPISDLPKKFETATRACLGRIIFRGTPPTKATISILDTRGSVCVHFFLQ